ANLKTRVKVTAGPHKVAVAFLKKGSSLLETTVQPLNVHFNFYRHPRIGPAVYEVSIVGPYEATGTGDTPRRQHILLAQPTGPGEEEDAAKRILATLTRRAFRRPLTDDDLKTTLRFYEEGRTEGNFESGIELALTSLLVNPQFLFHI